MFASQDTRYSYSRAPVNVLNLNLIHAVYSIHYHVSSQCFRYSGWTHSMRSTARIYHACGSRRPTVALINRQDKKLFQRKCFSLFHQDCEDIEYHLKIFDIAYLSHRLSMGWVDMADDTAWYQRLAEQQYTRRGTNRGWRTTNFEITIARAVVYNLSKSGE